MVAIRIFMCLLLGLVGSISAQTSRNHALLIGVDSYKHKDWAIPETIRGNIDSAIHLFTNSAYDFNFSYLRNEQVVLDAIRQKFNTLKLKEGDRLMIYMNGHGAQVNDQNPADERDGQDELFVCYDAPPSAASDFRSKCLVDDEFNELLKSARTRLGPSGQVFLLVESCHSSTIDKAGITEETNNTAWKSAFLSEEKTADKNGLAPLIVFSSSRASDQTPSLYYFSRYFFSTFREFDHGSYQHLFNQFYLTQRKKLHAQLGSHVDIAQTVNLSVEDPAYLQLGVLEDSVYRFDHAVRITKIDPAYPKPVRVQVNMGLYTGITIGTELSIKTTSGKEYKGIVDFASNGTAYATLNVAASQPSKFDLWTASVTVSKYKFQDTLNVHIDATVPAAAKNNIITAIGKLGFVQVAQHEKGYTAVHVKNKGLYILRNRDRVALYKVTDIRETLLKLQISNFIRQLRIKPDDRTTLILRKQNKTLTSYDLTQLKKGDPVSVFVNAKGTVAAKKYYAVLRVEDESVKQLVPVNFQINDSECKLSGSPQEIMIGKITIGGMNGRLLLLTSSAPLDLRSVLLEPVASLRDGAKLNEIEELIRSLFITRSDATATGLHQTDDVQSFEISYQVVN